MLLNNQTFSSLCKVTVATSFVTLGIVISQPSYAFKIVSDNSWLSNDTYIEGWEKLDFNDSSSEDPWNYAYSTPLNREGENPEISTILNMPTDAEFIWSEPDLNSNMAFLRKTFYLGIQPLESAKAVIAVDDDYEFYINGELAIGNYNGGFDFTPQIVDLKPYLKAGKNVFAIHAVDGSWDNPYPRVDQWVAFDAEIKTAPEPTLITGLLTTVGIGAATLKRTKNKSS